MLEAQIETQGINCLMLMYVINPTTNANKCNNIESVILKQPILICRTEFYNISLLFLIFLSQKRISYRKFFKRKFLVFRFLLFL